MDKKINVLFTASEADPFIKVGGLADVSGSLPKAILELADSNPEMTAVDIRLAIPYHRNLHLTEATIRKVIQYFVPYGDFFYPVEVYETRLGHVPVYLISGDWIRSSARVYDLDVAQTARKYLFFSKAVSMLPEALDWKIDILHANDWHTALAIPLVQEKYKYRIGTVLTIHNLPFMGSETRGLLGNIGLNPIRFPALPEWGGEIPLPIGSALADRVVAVSPSYAEEIMTPDFGCNLENFYRSISDKVTGILNGIDLDLWNPATEPLLVKNFSVSDLSGKVENKRDLQRQFNLAVEDETPLFVVISRFDQQKGIDLAIEALYKLEHRNWQAIILGSGSPLIEDSVRYLAHDLPGRVHFENRFAPDIALKLYAGGDMILIPSRYEPCGLTQMIGMRFGTLPVARATGGLKDTITPYDGVTSKATGFLFNNIDSLEMSQTIEFALDTYANKPAWNTLQANAMNEDFSWHQSALRYATLYQHLTNR